MARHMERDQFEIADLKQSPSLNSRSNCEPSRSNVALIEHFAEHVLHGDDFFPDGDLPAQTVFLQRL